MVPKMQRGTVDNPKSYQHCTKNNHEPIKFYCQRCAGPVCQGCFDAAHKFHSVVPYREYLHEQITTRSKFGNMKDFEVVEAVEAEMLTSLQLAHRVIAEYDKKLTKFTDLKKKREELQEKEAKTREVMGKFHEVKYFARNQGSEKNKVNQIFQTI